MSLGNSPNCGVTPPETGPPSAGLPGPQSEHVSGATERPLAVTWVPENLLRLTQQVWTKAYGREIEEMEALEILLNTKALLHAIDRCIP